MSDGPAGLASTVAGAPAPGPGQTPVHVDDPSFDSWEVVRDFGDVRTARAWHQALVEAGIEAVLTADWPLDRFGRGDIALRVRRRGLERGRAAALQPRLIWARRRSARAVLRFDPRLEPVREPSHRLTQHKRRGSRSLPVPWDRE